MTIILEPLRVVYLAWIVKVLIGRFRVNFSDPDKLTHFGQTILGIPLDVPSVGVAFSARPCVLGMHGTPEHTLPSAQRALGNTPRVGTWGGRDESRPVPWGKRYPC
ncbi:MAG: hypothetical protein AAFQ58_01585 [Pseudomonadota bacterium]